MLSASLNFNMDFLIERIPLVYYPRLLVPCVFNTLIPIKFNELVKSILVFLLTRFRVVITKLFTLFLNSEFDWVVLKVIYSGDCKRRFSFNWECYVVGIYL